MSDLSLLTDALRDATTALWTVSETPRLDAELLAAHGLQMDRKDMLMRVRDLAAPGSFANMISRRMAHEPVAYITGTQAFWDIDLNVTPDVLIPRSDSETLIEAAQKSFAGTVGPRRILDLGTGSGALLLAGMSLFPDAAGTGVDASAAALAVAQGNSDKLGFGTRTKFHLGNWRSARWRDGLEVPFDLILCNPPYVENTAILAPMVREYEPHSALFAGVEGLDDYRILLPQILDLLSPDGIAVFEIGHTQAQSVGALAAKAGLHSELRRDLAGNPRCLTMRRC
jgi:release factor glutamine methyltransferase